MHNTQLHVHVKIDFRLALSANRVLLPFLMPFNGRHSTVRSRRAHLEAGRR